MSGRDAQRKESMVLRMQSKKLNLVSLGAVNPLSNIIAIFVSKFSKLVFFFSQLSLFDPLLLQPQLSLISRTAKFIDSSEVILPAATQIAGNCSLVWVRQKSCYNAGKHFLHFLAILKEYLLQLSLLGGALLLILFVLIWFLTTD